MADVKRVRNIAEALECANLYPTAIGAYLAPLQTRFGGKRSWHGINPENHKQWISEADGDPAPINFDDGAESLPPLPPSKVRLWEVEFVALGADASELVRLRPRVQIDPTLDSSSSGAEESTRDDFADFAKTPLDGVAAGMLGQTHKMLLEFAKQNAAMARVVAEESRRNAEALRADNEVLVSRAAAAESARDETLKANGELAQQCADLKGQQAGWQFLGDVFRGRPEEFVEAAGKLAFGVLGAMQGKPVSPAA